jgi:hypothetical protein
MARGRVRGVHDVEDRLGPVREALLEDSTGSTAFVGRDGFEADHPSPSGAKSL